MRSAIRMTLAAAVLGLVAVVPQVAGAETPASPAVYRAADEGLSVTPVRDYRYAYRPYYGRYPYRPYAAYRPYYYGPYVRPYAAYRPYAYPYGVYPPYYGYSYYRPMPYYGGYYTYGRPGFSFGFGW